MAYDPLQSLQASPFSSIVPVPLVNPIEQQVPRPALPELFAGQQLAHLFGRERDQRQMFDDYCAWYDAIAQQNRQELAAMGREPDLLAWLARR